jgi:GTP:adenosylcobinamide-phosphate guanylyltransferase
LRFFPGYDIETDRKFEFYPSFTVAQEFGVGKSENATRYDAILVAGEGTGSHLVCNQHKALLKIKGKFVIQLVIEALQQVPQINRIFVAGPSNKITSAFNTAGINTSSPKKIRVVRQMPNLVENAWHAFLESLPTCHCEGPERNLTPYKDRAVLIVPCDAPLITPREITHFIDHCDLERYDYIVGLTPESSMTHFYPRDGVPGIKMAYLHMRRMNYRINNLHMVRPVKVLKREHINTMYTYRYQKNIVNAVLIGIYLMGKKQPKSLQYFAGLQLAMICSRIRLEKLANFFSAWTPKEELENAISDLMNTRFKGLETPYPGAALDIDNDRDFRTISIMFDPWREYLARL